MSDGPEHAATRPLSERRLTGKVTVITGAGTGIGRAAASAFAREGAAVVLAGRREAELQDVAAAITTAGCRAAVIAADVSSAEGTEALVKGTLDRFGRLWIPPLTTLALWAP